MSGIAVPPKVVPPALVLSAIAGGLAATAAAFGTDGEEWSHVTGTAPAAGAVVFGGAAALATKAGIAKNHAAATQAANGVKELGGLTKFSVRAAPIIAIAAGILGGAMLNSSIDVPWLEGPGLFGGGSDAPAEPAPAADAPLTC